MPFFLLPLLTFGFVGEDFFDTDAISEGFTKIVLAGLAFLLVWGLILVTLTKLGFFSGLFGIFRESIKAFTSYVGAAFGALGQAIGILGGRS